MEESAEDLAPWMERYQNGDGAAFEALYAALAGPLRRYLLGLARNSTLAEDLLQETFLQLHRARRSYQPGRPVRPWAFAIARHVALMDRRTRSRKPLESFPEGEAPEVPVPAEAEAFGDRDSIRSALATLPHDRREAIVLHHVAGLSFQEIGSALGIRSGAAKLRAHRGMVMLRELIRGPRARTPEMSRSETESSEEAS